MAATVLVMLFALAASLWMTSDAQNCEGLKLEVESGDSANAVDAVCFTTHDIPVSIVRCRTDFGDGAIVITFSDNLMATGPLDPTGGCTDSASCPRYEIASTGLTMTEGIVNCTCTNDPEPVVLLVPVKVNPALPPESDVIETDDTVTIGTNGCRPTGGTVNIDCEHDGGTPPFEYRWRQGSNSLPSETEQVLTVNQADRYRCIVSNDCPAAFSFTTITDQPVVSISGPVCVADDGNSIELTCNIITGTSSVISEDDITLLWSSDVGLTSPGPTISVTSPGRYTCTASSACGSSSDDHIVQGTPVGRILRDGRVAFDTECLSSPSDSIELDCTIVSGNASDVTVEWSGPSGTIGSNPITVAEFGTYTCTISRPGCGSSTLSVDVETSPELPKNDTVSAGPDIDIGESTCLRSNPDTSIDCTPLAGSAPFTYMWILNGITLSETSSRLEPEFTGTYTCIASNDCGEDQSFSFIFGPPEVQIRKGNDPADSIECVRGPSDTVDLECVVTANNAPEVTVSWTGPDGATIGGNPITVSGSNTGIYVCTASRADCGSNSDEVNVAAFPIVDDSNMEVPGPDINIGEDAILQPNMTILCTPSSGTGPFTYRWSRDGEPLSETSNMLSVDVPGEYACVVSGLCGDAEASTSIIRGVPPSISLPTDDPTSTVPTPPPTNMIFIGQDVCVDPGEDIIITISCDTEIGTPPIMFSWQRNGVPLADTGMSLAVPSNLPGTYTCIATNLYGTSEVNSTILESVTPIIDIEISGGGKCDRLLRPPPANVENCALQGDDVVVRCTASDGSSSVMLMPNTVNNSVARYENIVAVEDEVLDFMCITGNACGNNSDMLNLAVYDPAVVDIRSPLPPPTIQDAEVIGAGRSDESVLVMESTVLELYCPFNGVDTPSTMWVYIDPMTGEEVSIDEVPNANVVLDGNNLMLIINPFTSENEGTYRCNTDNIAGADDAEVVLRVDDPEPGEWVTTPWTRCEPYCHRGMRMRRVNCVGQRSGNPLPDFRCTAPKPLSMERCRNLGPCFTSPVWDFDPWTQCSRECGGGTRQRYVYCVVPATREVVPDRECVSLTPPSSHESCNLEPCCAKDLLPDFCQNIAGTSMCNNVIVYKTLCCWTCSLSGH